MAEAKENILTKGFSGTIARLLTFRQRAGKTLNFRGHTDVLDSPVPSRLDGLF